MSTIDAGRVGACEEGSSGEFRMSRRQMLLSIPALACMVAGPSPLHPFTPSPPLSYAAEAARLTDLVYGRFWDPRARMFRAPVRSAETVDSDPVHNNGYTLWPSLLGLHSLVEGEKLHRGRYRARIAAVYAGLQQYLDAAGHRYDAWLYFPGNRDSYYDDNAWVVITLVEASMASVTTAYRERAREVLERFMAGGWDDTDHPGGVRWGTDPSKDGTGDRTTSATAGFALAALLLARAGLEPDRNIARARKALAWIEDRLLDRDGLVRDGLYAPDWSMMETKWTYNTGVPIRAYVELYRLTKDPQAIDKARRLAAAATDRTKPLYDQLVRDPDKRFWFDSGYFVHYLADGLLQLASVLPGLEGRGLVEEVKRNANYAYNYLRDPGDGLYFRNFRLWTIGEEQCRTWQRLTGQECRLEADDSERSREARYEKLPVKDRPFAKTLLANAAYARLFWMLATAEKRPLTEDGRRTTDGFRIGHPSSVFRQPT